MNNDKRTLQNDLKETASKVWLAGLGALATARDEGSEIFKTLVDKGEAYEAKGRETYGDVKSGVEGAVDKAKGQAETAWDKVAGQIDDSVSTALRRFGVPARDEIAILTKRVEELTLAVEQLKVVEKKAAATTRAKTTKTRAAKPASKKTVATKTAKAAAAKTVATKTAVTKTSAAKTTAS